MQKSKLTIYLVLALLFTNLLLTGYILVNRTDFKRGRAHGGPEGPKRIIIERLHFDNKQVEAYEQFIQMHRSHIHGLEEQMMRIKDRLYRTLNTGDTAGVTAMIDELAMIHKEIETTNYQHFMEIKSICTSDSQKAAFEELTHEIADLFGKPRPPRP